MREYFKFEKDPNGRWYVVLPEWNGSRDELEMVCGADTMLDIISQGECVVEIKLDVNFLDGYKMRLILDEIVVGGEGGAWYHLVSDLHAFRVWLCDVTKFVFGNFPKEIYVGY